MTVLLPNGEVSGIAPAYVALCKLHAVPLLGIIQLGGPWDRSLRKLDGLPWSGWLEENSRTYKEDSDSLVFKLKRQLFNYLN